MPFFVGISEPSHSKKELADLLQENEKGIEIRSKHLTLY